ncbi:MAG: glycosyltransferase family 1 protein [Desulfuromonadales bacterium]|nr:MAG: glycosyltransferase family 1 protein [Desulfuromonadales bacterium]
MKVDLITPYHHPPVRGNAVTVQRIGRHLIAAGCTVTVHSLSEFSAEEISRRVRDRAPDVIHAFHAHLGGRVAREIARVTGIPYIVTLTGSDAYEALEDDRHEETRQVLLHAAAVVAFHKCVKCRVTDHLPAVAEKTVVIPQGVELPGEDFSWGHERFEAGERVFFLPAGLRPVKNIGFALAPLAELHREEPSVRLLVAGPVIDEAYGARLLGEMESYPFARYLGEVGWHAIGALYRRADVVLNTSLSEGGMANSVLEAMAFGRPVLASDIEGNRSLVKEGKTGLLFRDEGEFLEKARALLRDRDLRQQLGDRARQVVRECYSPEREAAEYRDVYGRVAGGALRG